MAKEITITLTDEQAQALEDYADHANNLEWYYDDRLKQNMPRRKYEDGEAVLLYGLSTFLAGVLAQCPPQSVQDAKAQMESLRQSIEDAGKLSLAAGRRTT